MRKYTDYISDVSPDELFNGLIDYGPFVENIPSFLTSEVFLTYVQTLLLPLNIKPKDYIRFSSMRNINIQKTMAIPEPLVMSISAIAYPRTGKK